MISGFASTAAHTVLNFSYDLYLRVKYELLKLLKL